WQEQMTQKKFPRRSVKHSSAAQRDVKGTLRKISAKQNKKKLCGGPGMRHGFLEVMERLVGQTVNEFYAAEAARRLGSDVSDSSQRTLTNFETPGSCIVTPKSTLPVSMVLRLCVTMM